MCQLNLYLIPKSVEDSQVKELFKKMLQTNAELYTWKRMNEETAKGYADFNPYACVYHCDCGSIISFLQDRENLDSWETVKAEGMKKELDRLNAIKYVMEQADYKIKLDKIAEKENQLLDAYFEKNKKENKQEINESIEKYQDFKAENEIILSSRLYSLERNQRTTKTEDGENIIWSSNCIYDVIEKTKNSYMNHYEKEFNSIKKLVEELLKICDSIKILPFWQDNKDVAVNNEKNITFNDFCIESIAYLKYNDILCIRR